MSNATIGMFVGLILALAAIAGGLGGFLLAVVLGACGLVLGLNRDGTIDVGALLRSRGRG
ncbi:DUF2273 domain-containing protein [Gordonia sp. zg691]|uniref:DUF2273 domain-containing protein n=1 Tax=Gordonia jinghuaiqii TaxID=2758710 RepID=A0A7D7LUI5_9ACTN|nr:DUF2273 domain-containing protein [Gordonia jinghuaiqii]MBD0859992.1 DUF2273 domain-containing protein [Gordonia jinghuaiqii]MCR5977158.1 DUF2273 domain-containing protein [Gordonia jinghuaiqii]QMT00239.1 DUF2273 domain-containing protein [Gordonia jinghuaiqii]